MKKIKAQVARATNAHGRTIDAFTGKSQIDTLTASVWERLVRAANQGVAATAGLRWVIRG